MKTSLMRTRWAAFGAAVAVSVGGGAVFIASAATTTIDTEDKDISVVDTSAMVYQPVTPCRLLDTRSGFVPGSSPSDSTDEIDWEAYARGYYKGKVGSTLTQGPNYTTTNNITVFFDGFGGSVPPIDRTQTYGASGEFDYTTSALGDCDNISFAGRSPTAVVVNLTVTGMSKASFITLYDYMAPASKPYVSTLTAFPDNAAQMNGAIVPLGTTGDLNGDSDTTDTYESKKAFRIYQEYGRGSIDVIVDVLGYYYNQTVVSSVTGITDFGTPDASS